MVTRRAGSVVARLLEYAVVGQMGHSGIQCDFGGIEQRRVASDSVERSQARGDHTLHQQLEPLYATLACESQGAHLIIRPCRLEEDKGSLNTTSHADLT